MNAKLVIAASLDYDDYDDYDGDGNSAGVTLPKVKITKKGTTLSAWIYADIDKGDESDMLLISGTSPKDGTLSLAGKPPDGADITIPVGKWFQVVVPLNKWVGHTTEIYIDFDTMDTQNNKTAGVFIDDIRINEPCK